ncbi:hypothetical protein CEXT_57521 [Caerostris extrusa]|uniref:Uncharacterized protein n=1 Tax=Caerostris extrusa TaxID=172846 RepID=A0AAV4NSE0_CAEEX|nr:hypothetical protein CEXT_57521 [Caerostris extrusa]
MSLHLCWRWRKLLPQSTNGRPSSCADPPSHTPGNMCSAISHIAPMDIASLLVKPPPPNSPAPRQEIREEGSSQGEFSSRRY